MRELLQGHTPPSVVENAVAKSLKRVAPPLPNVKRYFSMYTPGHRLKSMPFVWFLEQFLGELWDATLNHF